MDSRSILPAPRRAVDIIIKKRDGGALTREEISFFVSGVTEGTWPDYQASALLMAIVLRGMTPQETAWLTDAMVKSGIRVDLSRIPGIKVDKHSTGGVGDKTSLILAPVAAACGLPVPMMSGRGLGHTGGTLDKLEAIPGFSVRLSLEDMLRALQQTGCAMIGQTDQIAPADLMEVTMALTVPLLVLGRVAGTPADARRLAQKAIDSGAALDKFRRIIEVQGGDPHVVDDVSRLPQVKQRHLVQATRSGYI